MVSVCLPSDALLQHLPSYLGFSYLGRGVSLHGCSSKAQLLLLILDEGYLLTTAIPDLQRGIAPLGPPAPAQPQLFGRGVGPLCRSPWPRAWGCSSAPLPLASGVGAWGSSSQPPPLASGVGAWGSSSRLRPLTADLGSSSPRFLRCHSPALSAAAPDLRRGVTPLGPCPSGLGSSRLLPLTLDVG